MRCEAWRCAAAQPSSSLCHDSSTHPHPGPGDPARDDPAVAAVAAAAAAAATALRLQPRALRLARPQLLPQTQRVRKLRTDSTDSIDSNTCSV